MQAVLCLSWVVRNNVHIARRRSTPIAHEKLEQSQLFERDGTYGIDDALQNWSCPMTIRKKAGILVLYRL